ncbi:MAG: hypothetical protein JNJ81_08345 [Candidatus Accumulibacter sp.]|uniref:hypothetical protein n=1 Tax=Accumulibacter sp. TaxID=2053492 RepID=UPI001A3E02C0|nr:hypothetical protein [Accumulibacter sp.]MBL8407797.1 hypothetical protein [Accumulibacter sp.]
MNANKQLTSLAITLAMALTTLSAYAVEGLDAHGNQKVNSAMAKRWSEQAKGQKTPTDEKQVVNVGSKKQGTCNVNVGTTQPNTRGGRKNDVVVTTKEVINVCK